jgi:hypothetical protein
VQSPVIANLNLRWTETPTAQLSLINDYSFGAAQNAAFEPNVTHTTGQVQVTLTTGAEPATFSISCITTSANGARYTFAGQDFTAPAGTTTQTVTVSTNTAGPHGWTLTELTNVIWTFKSCTISSSS